MQRSLLKNDDLTLRSMEVNEVREFKIDHDEGKMRCKLEDDSGRKIDTYYIKKYSISQNKYEFHANLLSEDLTNEPPEKGLAGKAPTKSSMGYAVCGAAFIDVVRVYDGSAPRGGPWFDPKFCGIGTTLSALCMLDEDVNSGDVVALNLNRKLASVSPAKVKATIKKVSKVCNEGFIGLFMVADEGAGNVFFSAALKTGYTRMIVFAQKKKEKWCSLDVGKAQKMYNTIGTIVTLDWFFCKASGSVEVSTSSSCSIS